MLSTAPTEEIHQWIKAMDCYDSGDTESAIKKFDDMTPSSRTKFNMGCCYMILGDMNNACRNFHACVECDKHLAIAYFMLGLTSCAQAKFDDSFLNFEKSKILLRGNPFIDYRQLGLKYQLHEYVVLHNQAALHIMQGNLQEAEALLKEVVQSTKAQCSKIISNALEVLRAGEVFQLIAPPSSVIFRPSKAVIGHMTKQDYLGKATLLATDDKEDTYVGFSGLSPIPKRKILEKNVEIKSTFISYISLETSPAQLENPKLRGLRVLPPAPQKTLPKFISENDNAGNNSKLQPFRLDPKRRSKYLRKQGSKDDLYIQTRVFPVQQETKDDLFMFEKDHKSIFYVDNPAHRKKLATLYLKRPNKKLPILQ